MDVNENRRLYVKRLGDDDETPVSMPSSFLQVPNDWREDLLLYAPVAAGEYNLWILDMKATEVPKAFFNSPHRQVAGQFSPDGHWVAYESKDSKEDEVYLRRFLTADGKRQVSAGGGRLPRWRQDGKALFYLHDEALMEVDIELGATAQVGTPHEVFKIGDSLGYAVLPDGKRLILCQPIDPIPLPQITVVVNWADGVKRQ